MKNVNACFLSFKQHFTKRNDSFIGLITRKYWETRCLAKKISDINVFYFSCNVLRVCFDLYDTSFSI